MSFWQWLERIPRLVAVPRVWSDGLGPDFAKVEACFLRQRSERAKSYPCPRGCGCAHEVVEHDDGLLVAVCQCASWNCDDIVLSSDDVVLLELNWQKLGRAIARGFGCDLKHAEFGLPNTMQVGSFSGAALPIILTIQSEPDQFRSVVGQLIVNLRERFVLLAPTGRLMDAPTRGLIANAKSVFLDLESHLTLTASGCFQARQSAGELFSHLLGPGNPAMHKKAVKVFGLWQKLRIASERQRKAKVDDVFYLLVVEHQAQRCVAREHRCSAALVSKRVDQIETMMGLKLSELKALGSRLRDMEIERDPRARERYDRGLVDENESDSD